VLILGAIAAISVLVVHLIFISYVRTYANAAPDMLKDTVMSYIETEAPEMIDSYVETKLMPGIKEEMLGLMFGEGMGAPPPAAADEPLHRNKRSASRCPVSDTNLCSAFRTTCTAFQGCRTVRDRPTCITFVQKLNVACAMNDCDAYYDRALCRNVGGMCNMRTRCLFDQTACIALEGNMTSLCSLV
jgi:hypothetical protein